MRICRELSFCIVASVLLSGSVCAQSAAAPRPLRHEDYDQWNSLGSTSYSKDGGWVAMQITPQWGDGKLIVRQSVGELVHEFARGSGARFSADGKFVLFSVGKSKVAERDKKIEELRSKKNKSETKPAPSEQAPSEGSTEARGPARRGSRRGGAGGPPAAAPEGSERDSSEWQLLDLTSGKVEVLGKLKSAMFADEVPLLLLHRNKPETKPAAKEPKETKEPKEPKEPQDPLEKKRSEGTDLVLRDLATGNERVLPDVVAFGESRHSKWLWIHTSQKKLVAEANYGLAVLALPAGEPQWIFQGACGISSVEVDRDETALAFLSNREDFAAEKPVADLYLWEGKGLAERIAFRGAEGMPPRMQVAGGATFSRDGSKLSFSTKRPDPEDLPAILPDDQVNLDLWHWQDGLLQTMQQKRGTGERNPSYVAVYHRSLRRVTALGDEKLREARFLGHAGDVLLAANARPYEKEVQWDGRYADWWLVQAADSTRKMVLSHYRGNVTNSPTGKYLLYFGADSHWWAMEVATGTLRDLTAGLAVPFHEHEDDRPEPDAPYGVGGWTEHDAAVLLYDEFDVWRVEMATGSAVCVTDGYGRAQQLRLRINRLPTKDEREFLDGDLLLAATNQDTMAEGLFRDQVTGTAAPQRLYYAEKNIGAVTRPVDSTRYFFTLGTFADYPDLYTADAEFGNLSRLSQANPQQAQYCWGKSELVRWIDGDGRPRKGVLIKPDGFDPARKYPMLVYFYERMTQGLHNYVAPAPGTSPNAAYYVSNGYLWFMPDVVYETGYPGASCVKCVVSGVQHLLAQGFVDEHAIGAAGHSWGGYQTAFLVTRTHIFAAVESGAPVSNMLSAYGGIRYSSGMSRQFQYEQTQSRIGGTPWEYPLRYWENSPIHFADKVQTPVLILHNDQDGAVPWTQGIEYFTALRRLGKETYLFNYNGEDHGLRKRANMQDWSRRMAEYFAHHLKGEPAPRWMTDGVPFHQRDAEKLPFAPSYIDAYVRPAPPKPAATKPEPAKAEEKPAETPSGSQ